MSWKNIKSALVVIGSVVVVILVLFSRGEERRKKDQFQKEHAQEAEVNEKLAQAAARHVMKTNASQWLVVDDGTKNRVASQALNEGAANKLMMTTNALITCIDDKAKNAPKETTVSALIKSCME